MFERKSKQKNQKCQLHRFVKHVLVFEFFSKFHKNGQSAMTSIIKLHFSIKILEKIVFSER